MVSLTCSSGKWLNTCVGGHNYHLFFLTMTFAMLLLAYQFGISMFLFIESFQDDYLGESPTTYMRQSYGSFSSPLYQFLVGFTLVLSAPLFFSLVQLFLLHIYLWWRRMTTYEWIMERRDALKRAEEANAQAAQRAEQQRRELAARSKKGVTVVGAKVAEHSDLQPTSGHLQHGLDSPRHKTGASDMELVPRETPGQYATHETPGNPDADNAAYRYPLQHQYQQSMQSHPARAPTLTAAGVQLASGAARRPTSASGAAGSSRPHSHADRDRDQEHDEISRSESHLREDRTRHNSSALGRHAMRSRPPSGAVAIHLPRTSYSSHRRGTPDLPESIDPSAATHFVAPVHARPGSLPPLRHDAAASLTSSDDADSRAQQPIAVQTLPGIVASDTNPHADDSHSIASGIASPSNATPLPTTPTPASMHAYAAAAAAAAAPIPPPNIAVASHHPTRSLEEEATSFLAHPTSTEPEFQTISQKSRGSFRSQ